MKNELKLLLVLVVLLLSNGCATAAQNRILAQALGDLLFITALMTAIIILIYILNKFIVDEYGKTNDLVCSIVGVIVFPAVFLLFFCWKFSFSLTTFMASILLGGAIGWFSYVLDEYLNSFWENKEITIPAVLGLIMGGWLTVTLFSHVWLEGDMYISHQACARRIVIQRYTYHHQTDSDGHDTSYYSWDFRDSCEKFALGVKTPDFLEGKDYALGWGARRTRDKIGYIEDYYFIGGYLFSAKRNRWDKFGWLRLANTRVQFELGKIQRVQSNFYGNPINNAGVIDSQIYKTQPVLFKKNPTLPCVFDLPPPTTTSKALSMCWEFFHQLFSEEQYKDILLWSFVGLAFLGAIAAFAEGLRTPILVFLICFTIIVWIILLVFAGQSGALALAPRGGRRSGGGGGFGGRSSSG